jgi:hypothetical protein
MPDSFRRNHLFYIPAALILASVVLALLFRAPAVAFFGVVASLFGLANAIGEATKRLEITQESLTQMGYFGGPRVIHRSEVIRCKYRQLVPLGRAGFSLNVLEIVGSNGITVMVSKGGWGPSRHRLFEELSSWLAHSSAELGQRERAFLST